LYIGEWKMSLDGKSKVKHGQGKITFTSTNEDEPEEYDGNWAEDCIDGFGTYKFKSGNEYSGQWV